jgi:hypothetical protein
MKLIQPSLLATVTAALLLSSCDRGASQAEAQRLAEERAALEREKAALTAAKAAAIETANEQERQRIAGERAELEREKIRIAAERAAQQQQADQQARAAADRDARMAAERRAADEEAARRDAEAKERETQDARETQTVDFFYDALDPYGEWIEIDRYGYAFRPNTNQIAMWRPYTDGGWVYTEYGWTWRSNEPFGWATYHYGRWARLPRLGWVWIPGTEWGPAWVSWRRSTDYVGWAPLPPDAWSARGFNAGVDSYFDIGPGLYTFLRVVDFGEPTYLGHVVEPERNVAIINNTVNITKTVYKTVNNKMTIVNEGPDIAVINRDARRPVEQLKVQRVNTARPDAAKVQAGMLQVVAPELKKATALAKPKQVKESVKAAEVDRGWKVAKADSDKVRAEAAKEARTAEQAEREEAKAPGAAKPAPIPAPAPAPVRPVPPRLKRMSPEPKPAVEPPPAVEPSPGRPPVPGAEAPSATRPDRPIKPTPEGKLKPGAEPELEPKKTRPTPFSIDMPAQSQRRLRSVERPVAPTPRAPIVNEQPGTVEPATPEAGPRGPKRRVGEPTPVPPEGTPRDRRFRQTPGQEG